HDTLAFRQAGADAVDDVNPLVQNDRRGAATVGRSPDHVLFSLGIDVEGGGQAGVTGSSVLRRPAPVGPVFGAGAAENESHHGGRIQQRDCTESNWTHGGTPRITLVPTLRARTQRHDAQRRLISPDAERSELGFPRRAWEPGRIFL